MWQEMAEKGRSGTPVQARRARRTLPAAAGRPLKQGFTRGTPTGAGQLPGLRTCPGRH